MAQSKRQQQADARREQLLDVALDLFSSQGFDATSTQQIATAAGVTQGLVFHYFGSKAGLYEQIVRETLDRLATRIIAADAARPPNTSARDRVRATLLVYLDHIASHPRAWASPLVDGEEPREAMALRRAAQQGYVVGLREILAPSEATRHDYALRGYFGFLEFACLAWVERGCPDDERHPLVEAALGALEGALGDWGS